MSSPLTLTLTTPSEREVLMIRAFAASRETVFDAWTRPELVKRWLWAFDWPMTVCEIDFRVGGRMRYVWRQEGSGQEMGVSGTFREIVRPERIVHTELFDEDWTGGETVVTTTFDERDGRTTVSMRVLYVSEAARDAAMKTGMAEGVDDFYNKLDAMLAEAAGN